MKYQFIIPHRHHKAGDLVPDGYTSGMIQTMLASGRVAPVSEPAKSVDAPPADRMMRVGNVKRKGSHWTVPPPAEAAELNRDMDKVLADIKPDKA